MNPAAIIMMIVTILLVWGGLVASLVMLRLLPTPGEDEAETTAPVTEPNSRYGIACAS